MFGSSIRTEKGKEEASRRMNSIFPISDLNIDVPRSCQRQRPRYCVIL